MISFYLPYFHVSNNILFFESSLLLYFYIDVVLMPAMEKIVSVV